MIADYDGTAIVISHDRDFLDRVATSIPDVGRRRALHRICRRYSDMVAQRGGGVDRKAIEKAARADGATPSAGGRTRPEAQDVLPRKSTLWKHCPSVSTNSRERW